jgi:polysaccharide export outer membrane protein
MNTNSIFGSPLQALKRWMAAPLILILGACASSDPGSTMESLPSGPSASDSLRALEVNRWIDAAAARDSVGLSAAGSRDTQFRIGSNDQIEVTVFGAEEFSGTHRVGESGEISIPLLGSVMVGGKTPRELEADLERQLGETYMRDPHVSVQVVEIQSHGVSVVGAVRAPGVYQISGPVSLLEVLAMAQGLSEDAGSRVVLVRPAASAPAQQPVTDSSAALSLAGTAEASGQELVHVDLAALLESGRTSQNVLVHAGDIVQVQPAGLVYVVGQVNRPGGFTIPPGQPMTVLQALAMAEGLGSTAAASRSVIVREGASGGREEVPVDLEAVLEGSEPPPVLAARDVLFVPNNDAKSFGLGVVNALVSMVSLRGLFY